MALSIAFFQNIADYQSRFERAPLSNLLQDPLYGTIAARRNHQRLRAGLIHIDGNEAGIFQILEAGLFGDAIHAVILDRGPLWLEEYGNAAHQESFFTEFARLFPARFGRRRRIIPEWQDAPESRRIMGALGYKRLERAGYQTYQLDLRPDFETLRSNLKQKWRNVLNKAERQDLEITWDNSAAGIAEILLLDQQAQREKGFHAASMPFMQELTAVYRKNGHILAGKILQDGNICSAILFFCHGSGATYQIGWNSDSGRTLGANNFLIWNACVQLKKKGVKYVDLGGFNEEDAAGVGRFKAGLDGEVFMSCGQYL